MTTWRLRPLLLAISVSTAFILPITFAAQGFGSNHTHVTLVRKLPPNIRLQGTTLRIDVHGSEGDLAANLKSLLESELLKDDTRLRLDPTSPQTVLDITVANYAPPTFTETSSPSYAIGNMGSTSITYTKVNASLTAAFIVKSTADSRSLDSDNVVAKYVAGFDTTQPTSTSGVVVKSVLGGLSKLHGGNNNGSKIDSVPSTAAVNNDLLLRATREIAAHMVNTSEQVDVLLARGKLDDANRLAVDSQWSRYVETLETMPALPARDDAYRLYNIGVGYEAEAYLADTPKSARMLLEQAAINYGKALDARPDEKLFIGPQERIESAMAHYKKLGDQQATIAAAPANTVPALTNEKVIAMVKAGLDEANLVDTINTAPSVNFDLSPDGVLNLAQNGVKGNVLTAMKARARDGAK